MRWADHEARALVRQEWRSIEVLAHALVERVTIPGDEAHAIIDNVQREQWQEQRAAFEYLKENGLLPTEEEWREGAKKPPRLTRRLTRSHVASAVLSVTSVTLDAMSPERTDRRDVNYIRSRVRDILWCRGFTDNEIDPFLDTLIERRAREACRRPRLLLPLPVEEG